MESETTESGFTNDWQGERTLAKCNLYMLKNADTCDVSFRVGQKEEIVRAHSYILISRSCVFYSMLTGQWTKEDAIKIPDVSKEMFSEFLIFLYTDDCSLTADNVTGLLYLSNKYAVHRLHRLCLSFLKTNLTPENACVVLEQAHFFDEEKLSQDALEVINTNIQASLTSPDFTQLSQSCLDKILVMKILDLHVKPEVVFDRVLSWASAECSRQGKEVTPRNQREVLGESVYLIGFTGFDVPDFVKKVVPSKLLDDSECLKIMSHIACPDVEVVPFRTFSKKKIEIAPFVEIEMYNQASIMLSITRLRLQGQHLNDALDIVCDQETVLHSITVLPSKSEYEVTIRQADNTIVTTRSATTQTNAKIDLPSSVKMMPGLTYCVYVKLKVGGWPQMFMSGLKDSVCIGDKTLNFSKNQMCSNFGLNFGLIVKLTVS